MCERETLTTSLVHVSSLLSSEPPVSFQIKYITHKADTQVVAIVIFVLTSILWRRASMWVARVSILAPICCNLPFIIRQGIRITTKSNFNALELVIQSVFRTASFFAQNDISHGLITLLLLLETAWVFLTGDKTPGNPKHIGKNTSAQKKAHDVSHGWRRAENHSAFGKTDKQSSVAMCPRRLRLLLDLRTGAIGCPHQRTFRWASRPVLKAVLAPSKPICTSSRSHIRHGRLSPRW